MNSSPGDWEVVSDLFYQALSLEDGEIESFLERSCGDRNSLKEEVLSLLKHHQPTSDDEEALWGPAVPTEFLRSFLHEDRVEADSLEPGEQISDFRIIKPLGVGGFGRVYLAEDMSLSRQVALKVTPDRGEEARMMARLRHPNVAIVYSEQTIQAKAIRLVCMEFVHGGTLAQLLANYSRGGGAQVLQAIENSQYRESPISPEAWETREEIRALNHEEWCLWIAARLAAALHNAHSQEVLHLDIKPENILFTSCGEPKITDFNVSLSLRANERDPAPGQTLGGTKDFMAPEHARIFTDPAAEVVRALDHRADQYSLGKVLQCASQNQPSLFLEKVIERACAEQPRHRFESCDAMAQTCRSGLASYRFSKRIPPPQGGLWWMARYPYFSIFTASILPHFMGSMVSIPYNGWQVVDRVSAEQVAAFNEMLVFYNILAYSVSIAFCLTRYFPMFAFIWSGGFLSEHAALRLMFEPEKRRRIRQKLLEYPTALALFSLSAWLLGGLVFPGYIYLRTGVMNSAIFGHFVICFTVSGLIASTYSFLLTRFLVIRLFYPKCFGPDVDIETELSREGEWANLYNLSAGLVPLAAAIILVWYGKVGLSNHQELYYRGLISFLIVIGMFGSVSSILVFRQLDITKQVLQDVFGARATRPPVAEILAPPPRSS